MSNFAVVLVREERVDGKYDISKEDIMAAPAFDTLEEASNYCDLMNPDALWLITPLNDDEK